MSVVFRFEGGQDRGVRLDVTGHRAMENGIAINGRFLSQVTTGVQRYARELLSPGAWTPARDFAEPILALTQSAGPIQPAAHGLAPFEARTIGHLSGHAWEQLELSAAMRDAFLVNLCNTAPLNRENQLTVIHDMAVWRHPEVFSTPFRLLYRALLPNIARRSRALLTVSAFSAGELAACLGLGARAIEVVPNAGDHILRAPPDLTILDEKRLKKDGYLLAVGSANPIKNHGFLAHIEPLLAGYRLPLIFAGGSMPKLFAQGAQIRSPWLRHIGYVTDNALRALYENALGFIFPSLYEGCGVPPLEAMHCGCPVLASSAAAIPETCAGGAAYFDPRDAESLIALCRKFIASQDFREELRAAGKERAAQFSWKKSSATLASILSQASGT